MKKLLCLSVLFLMPFCSASPALAENSGVSPSACVREAKAARKLAVDAAKQDFDAAKLSCRTGGDEELGACFGSCENERKECLDPIHDASKECGRNCQENFRIARLECKSSVGCGSACDTNEQFLQCLAPALLTRFSCNAGCRAQANAAGRAACKAAFRSCIQTCKSQVPRD